MYRFLRQSPVFKTYRTRGNPESVLDALARRLLMQGMVRTGVSPDGRVVTFRHPSVFFSSKRPLTCFSKLSLEVGRAGMEVEVRVGATFTKVRNLVIFAMGFIWVGLPVIVGALRMSFPDFSPFGALVVPTGFLLHYSLRGSAFRYLKRLIHHVGETHELH